MFGLGNCFFDAESGKTCARQRLPSMRSLATTGLSADFLTVCTPNDNNDTKIAHNIATRFKNSNKYLGKVGEDINELIASYTEATRDYKLSATQNLKYFHNHFADDVRRFYCIYVQSDSTTFQEACIKIQTEYRSLSHQNRVRKYLQSLSLVSIMGKKPCNFSEALGKLLDVITRFTSQGRRTHQSEEDKVENLYEATIGAECA